MHAQATASAQGPLVLVVDDQPFFRAFLRNALARRGHTVLTADDADQAERLVDEVGPPLVLILDLMLPGVSGPELLHTLSQRSDADRLRFILVSAHAAVERVAPDSQLVVARLTKPVDLGQLAQHLELAGAALRDQGG
ncbi:MAG: response regulator [Myxococcaceae bacterium]